MVSVVPRLAPSSTFVESESLDAWLRGRERLSLSQARAVLEPVFSALSVAHAASVVHRDLSPDKVRISGTPDAPSVELLGLGIAKDFGVDPLSGNTPGPAAPLWTAPEQAREGYAPAPSADVWALGLLTFFALTGAPYRAQQLGGAELPPGFDAWFVRAVHRDPAKRFRDAAEAWQNLEPLLADRSSREHGPVLAKPAGFLTLVILSCIAVGLAIFWLLRVARI